jgi:hypothetical protein
MTILTLKSFGIQIEGNRIFYFVSVIYFIQRIILLLYIKVIWFLKSNLIIWHMVIFLHNSNSDERKKYLARENN